MNAAYTAIWTGLLIAWIVAALLRVASGHRIPQRLAALLGMFVGLFSASVGRDVPPVTILTAIFDPMAVTVIILIGQSLLRSFGYSFRRILKWELALFILLYLAFITTSIGTGPFDPYRLGYHPLPVGLITVVLIGYGAIRRNLFLPVVAIFGQILWAFDIGSSNYFDHVQHFLLLPIMIAALLRGRP